MAPYDARTDAMLHFCSHDNIELKREACQLKRDIQACYHDRLMHGHMMRFMHLVKKLADASIEEEQRLEADLDLLEVALKRDLKAGDWGDDDRLHESAAILSIF